MGIYTSTCFTRLPHSDAHMIEFIIHNRNGEIYDFLTAHEHERIFSQLDSL